MATRNPAVSVELEPHQNVAPEGLRNSQALASLRSAHRRLDRTARNYAENLLDERQALLDLKNAEPDSRIDVPPYAAGLRTTTCHRVHRQASAEHRTSGRMPGRCTRRPRTARPIQVSQSPW